MTRGWHGGIVRAINAITLPEKGSGISAGGEGTKLVAHEVWAKMLQRDGPCQVHSARDSGLSQKLMNGPLAQPQSASHLLKVDSLPPCS